MFIDTLCIRNFGPISELDIQFAPKGINVVFGGNASGKTQIVGAIQFALLGEMCDVNYFPADAAAAPSVVELVLADQEHKEAIRCEVNLSGSINDLAIQLNRTLNYALVSSSTSSWSESEPVMLHKRLLSLLKDSDSPTLVAPWEHLQTFPLSFDLNTLDTFVAEDDSLARFVRDLSELAKTSQHRLPDILSVGQRYLLALLQELFIRKRSPYSIPFILDSHLGLFGEDALQLVSTILNQIAEIDQVITLSSWPESFRFLEDEIKTRYSLTKPGSVDRDISLVSYAYYGESPEEKSESALIFTEGKTDWKHLKAALHELQGRGMYKTLRIAFMEYEDDIPMGDSELRKFCEQYSKFPSERKTICVFDRDDPGILRVVDGQDKPYKSWGNNVYSFAIPLVEHRPSLSDVCIELYYQDDEITRRDKDGRRLFLSTEFSKKSGRSKNDSQLTYPYPGRLQRSTVLIIDSDVFDENDNNVAMSKNQFAERVLSRAEGYDDFDFKAFEKIFEIIAEIVTKS